MLFCGGSYQSMIENIVVFLMQKSVLKLSSGETNEIFLFLNITFIKH